SARRALACMPRWAAPSPSCKRLEQVCRSITHPAIANDKPDTWTYRCKLLRTERLTLNRAGQGVLSLKAPYRDGTRYSVMSPLELWPGSSSISASPPGHRPNHRRGHSLSSTRPDRLLIPPPIRFSPRANPPPWPAPAQDA